MNPTGRSIEMDRGGGKTKPSVYQFWDCGKRGVPQGLGELPDSVREDSTDGASAIRALLRDNIFFKASII